MKEYRRRNNNTKPKEVFRLAELAKTVGASYDYVLKLVTNGYLSPSPYRTLRYTLDGYQEAERKKYKREKRR